MNNLWNRSVGPFDEAAAQRHRHMGLLDCNGDVNADAVNFLAHLCAGLFFDALCDSYDAVNESSSLQIKYEVDKILRSFISLSKYDLISCAKEWRANNKSFQSALDYIYLSKDIIIKQDVLIS